MRRRTPGVHHSFGNSLVIEVLDLLAKNLILHQSRAAVADTQRILIRADRLTLVRCHWLLIVSGDGREILVLRGGVSSGRLGHRFVLGG